MPEIVWGPPPSKGNARTSKFEEYRQPLIERSKKRKNPEDWWGLIFEYNRPATAGTRATDLRKRYSPEFEFASRTTTTGGAVWARVAPTE